ncbi:sugar transferase [Candidatus Falkowbacteria bacterium]|nr:MAG: sugar transferase [Candidatus Falkowbacteria bacterium]
MNYKYKKIFLLIGDILVLYLALYLTLLIRYLALPARGTWALHFWPFSLAFIAWVLIFYISDLYNLHIAVNNSKFFNLTLRSAGIAGLLTAVFFYINPHINIAPKTNLVIYIFVFTILFMLWRRLFNALLHSYLAKDNLAFIGYNGKVMELIKALQAKPHLGYKVSLIVNAGNTDGVSEVETTNNTGNLKEIILNKKISTMVLASDPHHSSELRSSLFKCLPLKINFINLPNFYETVTGKVPIDAISKMWFLENLSEGRKTVFDAFKRTYDFILALSILLLSAVFWPIIGIIIKIESPGPVFIKQTRLGRNNKIFTLIKFRSMTETENDRSPTKEDDKRITKFGRIIRKTRIDEIPQILNILTGSMSFVGPRPERPELVRELEAHLPFYRERMLVKPGLTGWDQVSGEYHSPSREDTLKKLQYDLFYIKNRSLYLDASIILKTIATVLGGGGV